MNQEQELPKTRKIKDDEGKVIAEVDARLLDCFCKKCERYFLSYTGVQCTRCGRLQ